MTGEQYKDGCGGPGSTAQQPDDDPDEIIPEEELPFSRLKITPDEDEEELSNIRTVRAWVVDILEPQSITTMLKWLKRSGLEDSELGHLKRIRKQGSTSTLLLSTSAAPPDLPVDVKLSDPYMLTVPLTSAKTMTSLRLKSSLWPTVFTPRRKGEAEEWSRGKVKWAQEAMKVVVEEAAKAREEGDLPIAAYVPSPYEWKQDSFASHDTRNSSAHPLRHSIMNAIRRIADYRTSVPPLAPGEASSTDVSRNGSNYLLTSLILFTTHEPCVMCSMALLHSRVKAVFYFVPMNETGGCGGLTCLPKLEGVNHRFDIYQWKAEGMDVIGLEVDPRIDA